MKSLLPLILLLSFAVAAQAARQNPASGRVTDPQGQPIEFATVVLMRENAQVAGTATDSDGGFTLKVPSGDYTLSIQYLGYQTITQQVNIDEGSDLGCFVLKSKATEIEGVVVKTQLIRREADRFVVDVANSPVAIGKDGIEMMQTAPGVWISDDQISINGKTGSKVYVNDRELKMDTQQLLSYLRGIRAEDIQKIEVIPTSGADYDADSSGGIIKITLRQKRQDGMEGGLYYTTRQGACTNNHNPYATLNYHAGKVDLFASAWADLGSENASTEEHTHYNTSNSQMDAASDLRSKLYNWGGRIGGVVELNPRHSIGAEFNYWHNDEPTVTLSQTTFRLDEMLTSNDSRYDTKDLKNNYSATFNYIWKIDTTGSNLKFIADYTHRTTAQDNDYFTAITSAAGASDSTYRNVTASRYDITTVSAAYEKVFSPKWTLKTGAKYTHNAMSNSALYTYLKNGAWNPVEAFDYDIDYTEDIAALYAIADAKLGRFGIAAGLRMEYTHTKGKGESVRQDYVSFFPNANLSWHMDKQGKHSLIVSYARNIRRPWFWALTPNRLQISDYTYQMGNPELKPQYSNDLSLTLVLAYKYTLSGGISINTDGLNQIIASDPSDPRKLFMTWENLPTYNTYYVSVNLPFQLTKWWSWNVNVAGIRQAQQVYAEDPIIHHNMLQGNTMMSFNLPAKFYAEVSYYGQTKSRSGNTEIQAMHNLNFSLKKRLWNDRITLSVAVRNVLDRPTVFHVNEKDFVREMTIHQSWGARTWQIGASYNFKSGKSFRKRSVESGSADEQGRL